MSTIFLSFSRTDLRQAEELCHDLESLGHEVWFDGDRSDGEEPRDEVVDRIRSCDALVLAVSRSFVESQRCKREFEYATTLGKPVLAVLLGVGDADAQVPAQLSALPRVDYTTADKSAMIALSRGLASLAPSAGPGEGAAPPERVQSKGCPVTQLSGLQDEIESNHTLAYERQEQLVRELKGHLAHDDDRDLLRELVVAFRCRRDVLARVERELADLENDVSAGSNPKEPSRKAAAPRSLEADEREIACTCATSRAQAVSNQGHRARDVNRLWWISPILFAIVGGVVAYVANRDADSSTARKMLVTGIAVTIIWMILAAGD